MTKRVIADLLHMRDAPSIAGLVVESLPRGTDVQVLTPGAWLFVRAPDGRTGWVHGGYLVDTPAQPAPAPPAAAPKPPRWRTAKSLNQLYDQVNALAPHRSRKFDGTIGDDAHQQRKSEHNPNSAGVVTAMDITHDPAGGMDVQRLADALRASRDPRIKYVIHNGRIFSGRVMPWKWRPYNGADPHHRHLHISVDPTPVLYDDAQPWKLW